MWGVKTEVIPIILKHWVQTKKKLLKAVGETQVEVILCYWDHVDEEPTSEGPGDSLVHNQFINEILERWVYQNRANLTYTNKKC